MTTAAAPKTSCTAKDVRPTPVHRKPAGEHLGQGPVRSMAAALDRKELLQKVSSLAAPSPTHSTQGARGKAREGRDDGRVNCKLGTVSQGLTRRAGELATICAWWTGGAYSACSLCPPKFMYGDHAAAFDKQRRGKTNAECVSPFAVSVEHRAWWAQI